MNKRLEKLKERLKDLPCPYCPYKGDFVKLLGHALSAHRVNLVSRIAGRGKGRVRKTGLRFIKYPTGRNRG